MPDDIQREMLAALERIAQYNTTISKERQLILEQQERMVRSVDALRGDLQIAGEKLDKAVTALSSMMWSLLKIPIACIVVCAASWAFLYSHKISETTWLIMLGVAVFPWLGDSITAIGHVFGIGKKGHENSNPKP